MKACFRSPSKQHVWRSWWICPRKHPHDVAKGCKQAFACLYCGEPGYAVPVELLEDE